MTEREEQRQVRERKLADLIALDLPCLPNRFGPIRHAADIKAAYETLEGTSVRVAGRLMRARVMGKASFAHILDVTGELQLYFKSDALSEQQYAYFKLLDLGDIIGVEGTVFRTRTGEISVQVQTCTLLAKSFLPLPEKHHGLTDVETRYRRRYLDLISNEETRRIFTIRTRALRCIRQFLDSRGFMEVETPILQPLYGGAAARPFTTHYRSLDSDVYLRISDELYLKRLIVGGFERVYEIGKDFRNEGISYKHSPEFTMLELYQAYADYRDIMDLIEAMFSEVAQHVLDTQIVQYGEHEIDFAPTWERLTIVEAVRTHAGIDLDALPGRDELLDVALEAGVEVDARAGRGKIVEELVSTCVEPHLVQPTFLYDFPVDFPGSLLAKRSATDPHTTERFELYIGGMEIANAFTELNEPADQRHRMEEATLQAGDDHAEVDRDYILALEHGMPPTGGLGFGIDRFIMLLANAHHVRETILFPLLRQREDHHAES